jgi:uncharacterized membrane protein YfcA
MDLVTVLCFFAFCGGILGGKILVTLPAVLLIKLTGFFMIVLLLINLIMKDL